MKTITRIEVVNDNRVPLSDFAGDYEAQLTSARAKAAGLAAGWQHTGEEARTREVEVDAFSSAAEERRFSKARISADKVRAKAKAGLE